MERCKWGAPIGGPRKGTARSFATLCATIHNHNLIDLQPPHPLPLSSLIPLNSFVILNFRTAHKFYNFKIKFTYKTR